MCLQRIGRYTPFPIFILCALLVWKHFTTAAGGATRVLSSKANLIKSVPFPTMVLPLALVLSGFAYFLVGSLVLIAAAALWPNDNHSGNWWTILQLLPLAILQLIVITGICLAISCLGVLLRDLELFITHLLKAGFFLSPALYGVDLVRTRLDATFDEPLSSTLFAVYMLNPFAILMTGYQDSLFYGSLLELEWWCVLIVEAGVLAFIGYRVYQYYDRRVIKFI